MSRPGPSAARNLTLTEELEKLEQSITLTLQEIDHNFSKAHRIVTTSILPLVEQYGEHSKAVWEASKFWKQFFEASANVSLSGYEELAGDGETTTAEETTLEDTTPDYHNTTAEEDLTVEQSSYADQLQGQHDMPEDSILDHAEITGSTPRAPSAKSIPYAKKPQIANYESPYEKLRRELKGDNTIFKDDLFADDDDTLELPSHADTSKSKLPDMSMTPRSSSLLEEPGPQSATGKHKDPLLHRVLDKNYRLQATPHKTAALPQQQRNLRGRSPAKPGEGEEDRTRRALWTESPMSSPEMAVPKLRSDLYMSPIRLARGRPAISDTPRTPGVSVQTPGTARKTRDIFAEARERELSKGKAKKELDEIDWDSDDDDDFGGMSPPKTIQFALPPSKLMQTPAREASKRIVDDILITAGAAPEDSSEYSPTMVKMNQDILDDTF
ncbi:DASH complex subunit Ask1-domain-containing protein [Daldinia sp. FL1419]|nr:DASH complex subunit Ask1-domain-containing protein [Daldinia sp. FL1419]